MRIISRIALTAIFGTIGAGSAAAQCVSFDPAAVPDIRVDPLDATGGAQIMQPVSLTIRRTGANFGPVKILYQIVDEDSPIRPRVGMTGGPQIEWRSTESSRHIGATRNENYALLRSGTVGLDDNQASKQIDLRLFVENLRDDLPAGVYREHFTVRFWCGDIDQAPPFEVPGIISVAIQVPNVLSANIGGASTRGEIDFMDFSALSRAISISVRSTGGYQVSVRSENGGAMLREGAVSPGESERIPYRLSFDGSRLALGQAGLQRPRAGLAGQQIPLNVDVDDVSAKRAGVYRDTIILTLSPSS